MLFLFTHQKTGSLVFSAELLENKNHHYLPSYQTLTSSINNDNNKEAFLESNVVTLFKENKPGWVWFKTSMKVIN